MFDSKIVPYESIMFDDCFIEILFTVLNAFNRPNGVFFANEIGTYTRTNDANKFLFKNQSVYVMEIDKVLESLGIKMERFYEREDVIRNIKEKVDSEYLVIARIDEFYFSKCPNYQKEHLNYNILIYNYNDSEFNIVGMYKENGIKFTINYEEFLESISNYDPESGNFLYSTYKEASSAIEKHSLKEMYAKNIIEHKKMLYDNLGIIDEAIKFYKGEIDISLSNLKTYTNPLEHIILWKHVDIYKHSLLLSDNSLDDIVKNIISSYKIIYMLLIKNFHKYKTEDKYYIKSLSEKLTDIKELELEYLSKLYQNIERNFKNE